MAGYGRCATCGKELRLEPNGRLVAHSGRTLNRCAGSGAAPSANKPAPRQPVRQPIQHADIMKQRRKLEETRESRKRDKPITQAERKALSKEERQRLAKLEAGRNARTRDRQPKAVAIKMAKKNGTPPSAWEIR